MRGKRAADPARSSGGKNSAWRIMREKSRLFPDRAIGVRTVYVYEGKVGHERERPRDTSPRLTAR